MENILDSYIQWLRIRQYASTTVSVYTGRIRNFLQAFPNPETLHQKDLLEYILNLGKRVSFVTASATFSTLKNFLLFLTISGCEMPNIAENPLKNYGPIKRPKTTPRIIKNDDLQRVLRAPDLKTVKGVRDYNIMIFLLAGLRASEICDLNTDDVFLDGWGNRKLTIHVTGKGRKERNVICESSGDSLWAWERWKEYRGSAKIPELFPSYYHGKEKKLTREGLYHILQTYGRKAGVRGINPHAWRHTAAVKSLEEGISIKEIQVRLGHASISTTERYTAGAAILQEGSVNSQWIHRLKKADLRHRRRKK